MGENCRREMAAVFFACAKNVSNVVHLVSFVLSMREYFLLRIQSGAATETERVFL